MGKFAPPKCPSCGEYAVKKEFINGVRTGDWSCAKCGDEGMLSDEPWPKPSPPESEPNKS